MKQYEIGHKTYVQHPIVLGQLQMLLPLMGGMAISTGSPAEIAAILGAGLPRALAIVLIEQGSDVRESCSSEMIETRMANLEWSITPELALEVVEDFFVCNRTSSLVERIREGLDKLMPGAMGGMSSQSSTPLQEEISPNVMQSSGESQQA